MEEEDQSIVLPCLRIRQPIGEFYIATIGSKTLCDITHFDVRRMKRERDFETYLGIQRPLRADRVEDLQRYVNTVDASFPTAIILAVPGVCAQYDPNKNELTLSNYLEPSKFEEKIHFREIAKVLDGQHRIEGLKGFNGKVFEINVSIFIDIDVADQAYIFSTVNLAQTKVNRSLAYDLFDLAKARSPQKVCHNIAVALDQSKKSPFFKKIKRLGVATEGRFNETITQATFIESLMPYISSAPLVDRDIYLRGKRPKLVEADELEELIFRNMFIEQKDLELTDILWNYFSAVKAKWPESWEYTGTGRMLNRNNGFKALMRFLKPAYRSLTGPGEVPSQEQFLKIFQKISLKDEDFNVERFKPGSSGAAELYRTLLAESKIPER